MLLRPNSRFLRVTLVLGVTLAVFVPVLMCGLIRTRVVVPAEMAVKVGPVRVATTCYSRKRFCLPLENANLPPNELFVLLDWPGGERREDVLLVFRLR